MIGHPIRAILEREQAFLRRPLNLRSRLLLVLAAATLAAALFFPVWQIRLVAPQYRTGLSISIYAWKLDAGNGGQDLVEVNLLNHYIGMRPIAAANFLEMRWMPFALGLFFLLVLRAVVLGQMIPVIDLAVLFAYFGLFSLGTLAYRLYSYGHDLDPAAAMKIEPFMPAMIGVRRIANFTQSSFPMEGAYLLVGCWLLIVAAGFLSRREKPL